jgi:hypothetical protein
MIQNINQNVNPKHSLPHNIYVHGYNPYDSLSLRIHANERIQPNVMGILEETMQLSLMVKQLSLLKIY